MVDLPTEASLGGSRRMEIESTSQSAARSERGALPRDLPVLFEIINHDSFAGWFEHFLNELHVPRMHLVIVL